jgi:site-specific DNA-methyltransferase (adenine-specific)
MDRWESHNGAAVLHCGDCLPLLRALPDASVDAVVTDPPAGIGFMGKEWDSFPVRDRGKEASKGARSDGGSELGFARGFDGVDRSPKARDLFIDFIRSVMVECLRVLKPGGHALVWAIPRTSHWTATAIEDAGFEIRDRCSHIFGSGFPKSRDPWRIDVQPEVEKQLRAQGVTGDIEWK